jgi:hypothetical protein
MRSETAMKHAVNVQNSEFGGAGVKFTIFLVVLFLIAHAGYNYVPVAYEGESFKQEMQTAVVNGLATPRGNPADYVKAKLQKTIADYELPPDTVLEVKQTGNNITAHASYSKKVGLLPFGMYDYIYQFDQTATPTGYLLKQ